ncbi:T9SS type A sorting domain-containing protein [Nibribacter ruber]|uniref:T9SS type A sorting domain-containing protein n=1 Tax=Nibribacter ruber TaxID=2698458 RepID=A0A6P1NYZ7_9BACT|nr:T9SS type A sorting domain-containing protein [Nibribacter ruber]QHL87061.1 T9SS type A sorting domain-containing protein [Nibribacter ruber]
MSAKVGAQAGTLWVRLEELNAQGQKTGNSIIRTLAVSPFPNPLPVELVKFAGVAKSGAVELSWSTASEKNNDRYEVERSANGRDFLKIGTVTGAGNSSVLLHYQFLDSSPLSGTTYYRLKQVDYDLQYEYSKVIAVKTAQAGTNFEAVLSPNPVVENLLSIRLKNYSSDKGAVELSLTDLSGKVVFKKQLDPTGQEIRVEFNPNQVKKGMYLATVTSAGNAQVQRILIQ